MKQLRLWVGSYVEACPAQQLCATQEAVPCRGVWLGCCCTLAGTVLITLDHSATAVSDHGSGVPSSLGDDPLPSSLLQFMLAGH